MNLHVIRAIFRRNFVSYFANPTGYVFICVFVLLGSFAAFWPDEFFNANLANLDQLNRWFPYIMLVFIPAITMSIWADEKRQGTDELLLTIPAGDLDVVLGKYLSAVAIYSVALLFSLFCNLAVLCTLGLPDVGLFLGTYFGYWMVGLAMLAIGMVASFLTGNLTVAFILGVAFNAPLVFLNVVDAIVRGSEWTATAKGWSVGEQMSDFGRGVISLSSIVYFLMIVVVMLYLCMVLIGRRHWLGGRGGKTLGPHYVIRALALMALAIGFTLLAQNWNMRVDATAEGLNSLSAETKSLIASLDPQHPVVIEAYISPNVPEEFVQTKLDLENMLREFEKLSHGKIEAKINDQVEPLTEEAQRAQQQFGISAQDVVSQNRGVWKQDQIFLGAAMTCGLEKFVIPFFERGIPVEYELVRSIATVTQQKRKRVGVLQTDVELFGGFDLSSGMPRQRPKERLIEELEKQYDVVRVDPNSPIKDRYDVLLAVQPSSLNPQQMTNFVDAVRSGQPTAIFEDPLPIAMNTASGTGQARRPRQEAMMMMQPPPTEPKGDIKQLWDLLGVELLKVSRRSAFGELDSDYAIAWQDFKPRQFAGIERITPEWVFISKEIPPGDVKPFNETDSASSGLQELLLLFPGAWVKLNAATTNFEPLVKTGTNTGAMMVKDVMASRNDPSELRRMEGAPTKEMYVLAAHITGKPKSVDSAEEEAASDKAGADAKAAEAKDSKKDDKAATKDEKSIGAGAENKAGDINVILVADVDMLHSEFFDLRARRVPEAEGSLRLDTDNVTFVLNLLDVLAGDTRFVDVRKRQPVHRPLSTVVARTQDARDKTEGAVTEFNKATREEQDKLNKEIKMTKESLQDELDKLRREGNTDARVLQQKMIELSLKLQVEERRKEARIEQSRREAQQKIDEANRELTAAVRGVQDDYKLWSVILPPVPPLLVAFFVFFHRRTKEREGVSKARLR